MGKMCVVTLILVGLILSAGAAYGETIYTEDGEIIQGKITEIDEDTIWVEITEGDITEYIGVDKINVEKILNDDGSVYDYSQTNKKAEG